MRGDYVQEVSHCISEPLTMHLYAHGKKYSNRSLIPTTECLITAKLPLWAWFSGVIKSRTYDALLSQLPATPPTILPVVKPWTIRLYISDIDNMRYSFLPRTNFTGKNQCSFYDPACRSLCGHIFVWLAKQLHFTLATLSFQT